MKQEEPKAPEAVEDMPEQPEALNMFQKAAIHTGYSKEAGEFIRTECLAFLDMLAHEDERVASFDDVELDSVGSTYHGGVHCIYLKMNSKFSDNFMKIYIDKALLSEYEAYHGPGAEREADQALTDQEKADKAEEEKEGEEQSERDEIKLQIVENLTEMLYKELDKQVFPHAGVIAYPDMVDIMVGIIQGNAVLMLKQTAAMGQSDAFWYMKQRWYLTGIEMLKSLAKIQYGDEPDERDAELAKQVENFEVAERQANIDKGVACATPDCVSEKEPDGLFCISCIEKKLKA